MASRSSYRNSPFRLYDSVDVSLLETDLILPGVADSSGDDTDCKVVESDTPDNKVKVLPGRVYISGVDDGLEDPHTERIVLEEEVELTVPPNTSGEDRVHAVVAVIKAGEVPNENGNNTFEFVLIPGTNDSALSNGAIAAELDSGDGFERLANIIAPDAFTEITDSDIEDTREPMRVMTRALKNVYDDLSSNQNGLGASLIGVEDAGDKFVEDTVEGVLGELKDNIDLVEASLDLSPMFGDRSDGSVEWDSNTDLDPTQEYNFETAVLDEGVTLSVDTPNIPLCIKTTGDVTINGIVDLNEKGAPGGAGGVPNAPPSNGVTGSTGTAGNSILAGATNGAGSGGGGGSGTSTNRASGGGGGSGASSFQSGQTGTSGIGGGGTPGAGGAGGTAISSANLALLNSILRGVCCGAGGGGGGTPRAPGGAALNGGRGGNGGGALVWYVGGDLTLGASSVIRCDAEDGQAGGSPSNASGSGGGGGGSGGHVVVLVRGSITNNGATLTASAGDGGAGGTGTGDGSLDGGAGAAGRAGKVVIFSLTTGQIISS